MKRCFKTGATDGHLPFLAAVTLDDGEKLKVVATTNILGDVIRNIGGYRIDLTVLMGIGVDPPIYDADSRRYRGDSHCRYTQIPISCPIPKHRPPCAQSSSDSPKECAAGRRIRAR
jgi:hypothetical protein